MTTNMLDGIVTRVKAIGTSHFRPNSDGVLAHMPLGLLTIDDGTGFAQAGDGTNFNDIKAAPVSANIVSATSSPPFTLSATNGTITANDDFIGLVWCTIGLLTAVNSQVNNIQVLQNSTALRALQQTITQAASAVIVNGSTLATVVLVTKGDVFKTQVKSTNATTFTLKGYALGVLKIADVSPVSNRLAG